MHATGRPVLIGTRSIDKSEKLSAMLTAAGIPHQVLNARQIAAEAEIISEAGQAGRVTVSTNMAGRGTDIRLGEGIAELGGLHVICTEMHDAARVDRQLIGRCGRQGDPGSYRQYLSLDDDILMYGLGPKQALKLAETGRTLRRPLRRTGANCSESPTPHRTPPLPRPQGAHVSRKGTQESADANGAGSVSGFAGIVRLHWPKASSIISGMFSIEFTSLATEHLNVFRKNQQQLIVSGIEVQLTHEPHVETRNRKKMRPNKVAQWELRIGPFRVFYNLIEASGVVSIEAIGLKTGSVLLIAGKQAEL